MLDNKDAAAAFMRRILPDGDHNGCSRLFELLVGIKDDQKREWVLSRIVLELARAVERHRIPIRGLRDSLAREVARNCLRILIQAKASGRTSDVEAISDWAAEYLDEIDRVSRSGEEAPPDIQLILRWAARERAASMDAGDQPRLLNLRRAEYIERGIRGGKALNVDDPRIVERVATALDLNQREARRRIIAAQKGQPFSFSEAAKIIGFSEDSLWSVLGERPLPSELQKLSGVTGYVDPIFRHPPVESGQPREEEPWFLAANTGDGLKPSSRVARVLKRIFGSLSRQLDRGGNK